MVTAAKRSALGKPSVSVVPTSQPRVSALGSGFERRRHALIGKPLGLGVLKFGFPLAGAMALAASFNLVDLFVIGQLPNGATSIAALAICDIVIVVGTILSQGVSNSTVAIVGGRFGAGDLDGASRSAWSSLWVVVALSVVFGLIGFLAADPIVHGFVGAEGELRVLATDYLRVLMGHGWTMFLLLHLTALKRALGDARWSAIVLIGANVLNVLLDVLLVFGSGPAPAWLSWAGGLASFLGIPQLGVVGAAWASVIARALGCLAGGVILYRARFGMRFAARLVAPCRVEIARLVRVAAPSSAQFVVRVLPYLICMVVITRHYAGAGDGPALIAAFGICTRLEMLALFQALGWSAAAATYVGVNLGAGQRQRATRAGWIAAAYCAASMLLLAGLLAVFVEPVVAWFDDGPDVIAAAREYVMIVAWSWVGLGVCAVLSHGIQGAGATMRSFMVDTAVVVGMQIPAILVVGSLGLPRTALWGVLCGANVAGGALFAVVYARARWLEVGLGRVERSRLSV